MGDGHHFRRDGRNDQVGRQYGAMPRGVYLFVVCLSGLVAAFNLALLAFADRPLGKAIGAVIAFGAGAFLVRVVWYRRKWSVATSRTGGSQFGREYGDMSPKSYLFRTLSSALTCAVLFVAVVFARGAVMKICAATLAVVVGVFLAISVRYRRKWAARRS